MTEKTEILKMLQALDEDGELVRLTIWQILEMLGYDGTAHRRNFAKNDVDHVENLLDEMLKANEITSEFDWYCFGTISNFDNIGTDEA